MITLSAAVTLFALSVPGTVAPAPTGADLAPTPITMSVATAHASVAFGAAHATGPSHPSGQDLACQVSPNMALEGRASPMDSTSVSLADGAVKLCYGSPSARDRTMIGGEHVPFGELWRMGANEPTMLHTSVPLSVAGISIEPGSYAMYTIPGDEEWEIFLSRSTEHWGLAITDEVRAMEVGSATVESEALEDHVEALRFRFEEAGTRSASLVLEWETTRIAIPVTATGG